MIYVESGGNSILAKVRNAAVVAVSGMCLTACMGGGSANLWQGQEVLVEARQDVLERDVYEVSDNHRELLDRFDALERLYVELAQQVRSRDQEMKALEAHVNEVKKDPSLTAAMREVSNDVSAMRREMKTLENRVFSVELTGPTAQPINQPNQQQAPTGSAETGAAVGAAEAPGTPVSSTPSLDDQRVFFGVHLASYRSQDQVNTGWAGLEQNFGSNLNGLTPLIYTQSQEGIGTFLRLIAGPLLNEQEAADLCGRIRQSATEQYCRVTEYQGEPIG